VIPTQDPAYTATRLLRLAAKAKKPVRIFLGVHPNRNRLLVAVDDAKNLIKAGPREELFVAPDMHPDTLAAALVAIWSRIAPLVKAVYPQHKLAGFAMRRRA